jgi:hypothetical protein
MLLYPILTPDQHRELLAHGRLIGRWRFIDPYHVQAYRWMVAAMRRRGIDTRGRPPVWAWHSFNPPLRRKPDLRSSYSLTTPGTRAVRLVIDVPDRLVLLSDFEAWHAVLNNWYLSFSEAEHDRKEALEDRGRLTRSMIESSWNRIFDLRAGDPVWRGEPDERQIQACLPYLTASWVLETTPFRARGTPSG